MSQDNQHTTLHAHLDRLSAVTPNYTSRYSSFQKVKSKTRHSTNAASSTPHQRPSNFPASDSERNHAATNAAHDANSSFDIVSQSLERGWPQHFHHAPFAPGDTIQHALAFLVYRIALLMGLRPGMKVLDVGCGIGGAAREIAKLVGCEVVGVSISQDQVNRAIELTAREGLGARCTFVRGDFMELSKIFGEQKFDAVYAIEACCCYASVIQSLHAEMWKVLKMGGRLGISEWVMTEKEEWRSGGGYKFDEKVARFSEIRNRLEVGGGIIKLRMVQEVRRSLESVGFEILLDENFARHYEALSRTIPFVFEEDGTDPGSEDVYVFEGKRVKSFSPVKIPRPDGTEGLAPPPQGPYPKITSTEKHPIPPPYRPWYYPIMGTKESVKMAMTVEDKQIASSMRHTNRRIAFFFRKIFVWLGLSPPAMLHLNNMMSMCIDASVEAAEEDIFSPSWMFICGKGTSDSQDSTQTDRLIFDAVPKQGHLHERQQVADATRSLQDAIPRQPRLADVEDSDQSSFSTLQTSLIDMFDIGVLVKP